jgi:UDP-N-acetylglucosamine/UDP-N-acetylgalactosamine diphosphorylase
MHDIPREFLSHLRDSQQDHIIVAWEKLSPAQRQSLLDQLRTVNFRQLMELVARANRNSVSAQPDEIAPLPVVSAAATPEECGVGEEALRRGEVAALVVAGGQGSRLGFEKPKGMYPVGPLSGASLFQLHAEKILGLSRRHRKAIPFLVMTSRSTDEETKAYFADQRYFGLDPAQVIFFQQGVMPAVCGRTGRLLLEGPGELALSPNGHGGTITALAECGLLDELASRGVRHIYYFQVDNPLLKICDPGFIGKHVQSQSEVSSKVVFKERPEEKVGVFAVIDGKCGMIEYSDLPPELASAREPTGELRFRAGNPAIHLFTLQFLKRITSADGLPYHVARKSVRHYDPLADKVIDPSGEPNALKFERFIFDALPLAERWLAIETSRAEEFCPLKNATGPDSPETVRAGQLALHASWLEQAGIATHGHPVEVSPLFALDPDELMRKIPAGFVVQGPTHLR